MLQAQILRLNVVLTCGEDCQDVDQYEQLCFCFESHLRQHDLTFTRRQQSDGGKYSTLKSWPSTAAQRQLPKLKQKIFFRDQLPPFPGGLAHIGCAILGREVQVIKSDQVPTSHLSCSCT